MGIKIPRKIKFGAHCNENTKTIQNSEGLGLCEND